jgi:hypothetical protein
MALCRQNTGEWLSINSLAGQLRTVQWERSATSLHPAILTENNNQNGLTSYRHRDRQKKGRIWRAPAFPSNRTTA